MQAATAAPEPEEEPPGWCAVFQGLRAGGNGQVEGRAADGEFMRRQLRREEGAGGAEAGGGMRILGGDAVEL
jgi:hypothetical protein